MKNYIKKLRSKLKKYEIDGYVITKNGTQKLFTNRNSDSMEALGELENDGFSRVLAGKLSLESKCGELMNSLGFATVDPDELSPGIDNMKNFSLLGSENIDSTIENSKIIDPDLEKLTPIKHRADDKFKSASDSF